jgi:cytidine deaminase
MVKAATEAVDKYGDKQNHTVAAAVVTADGKVITGLNLFHFTGGPCGEIVAVANAISNGEKGLTAIVAVGDRTRGILAPCGRCRQILFDYYPSMQVILRRGGQLTTTPIRDLLPETYDWNQEQVGDTPT